jgi:phosphatidylglycerol:prolipoprotein diacylglycerol transferase
MSVNILEIVWNFEPRIIPSWSMPVWYGIMWAMGFLVGYRIMDRMLKFEKAPQEWMDKVLIYCLIGGILGARFGHVFFYDWADYKDNPIDVLKIWEGGLASHGGAIGIIIAAFLLSRFVTKKSILYILDRLVVPTALAAFFIRMGNLFNHEIVGKPTGTDFGFKFLRHDIHSSEAVRLTGTDYLHDAYGKIANDPNLAYVLEQVPNRYPAQLYEALCYIVIFGVLMWLYWRTNASLLKGFLLGAFFTLLFSARFFIEYLKESQGGSDDAGLLADYGINMGQMLSLPLVIFGLFLVFRNVKNFKKGKIAV